MSSTFGPSHPATLLEKLRPLLHHEDLDVLEKPWQQVRFFLTLIDPGDPSYIVNRKARRTKAKAILKLWYAGTKPDQLNNITPDTDVPELDDTPIVKSTNAGKTGPDLSVQTELDNDARYDQDASAVVLNSPLFSSHMGTSPLGYRFPDRDSKCQVSDHEVNHSTDEVDYQTADRFDEELHQGMGYHFEEEPDRRMENNLDEEMEETNTTAVGLAESSIPPTISIRHIPKDLLKEAVMRFSSLSMNDLSVFDHQMTIPCGPSAVPLALADLFDLGKHGRFTTSMMDAYLEALSIIYPDVKCLGHHDAFEVLVGDLSCDEELSYVIQSSRLQHLVRDTPAQRILMALECNNGWGLVHIDRSISPTFIRSILPKLGTKTTTSDPIIDRVRGTFQKLRTDQSLDALDVIPGLQKRKPEEDGLLFLMPIAQCLASQTPIQQVSGTLDFAVIRSRLIDNIFNLCQPSSTWVLRPLHDLPELQPTLALGVPRDQQAQNTANQMPCTGLNIGSNVEDGAAGDVNMHITDDSIPGDDLTRASKPAIPPRQPDCGRDIKLCRSVQNTGRACVDSRYRKTSTAHTKQKYSCCPPTMHSRCLRKHIKRAHAAKLDPLSQQLCCHMGGPATPGNH